MDSFIHPARRLPFDELYSGLQAAKDKQLVYESISGEHGLHLYCYTNKCVYERAWDEITLLARGLIIDVGNQRIAATPFPKFFNYGEVVDLLPEFGIGPFEVFEKLDGSLITIFHHNGRWLTATKGSFNSTQAQWAAKRLAQHDCLCLDNNTTYLCEAIYPANKIVVNYPYENLVLLAAYRGDGSEVPMPVLRTIGTRMSWRLATSYNFISLADLLTRAKTLTKHEEGFVVRFRNGFRIKIKGEEYLRLHRIASQLTPLAIWDAMQNVESDILGDIRRNLPEELWGDFDTIVKLLTQRIESLIADVRLAADKVSGLSDKEVGLLAQQHKLPAHVTPFIFAYRKNNGDLMAMKRVREAIFRAIRPTNNHLDGYVPSAPMNRIQETE